MTLSLSVSPAPPPCRPRVGNEADRRTDRPTDTLEQQALASPLYGVQGHVLRPPRFLAIYFFQLLGNAQSLTATRWGCVSELF